MPQPGLPAIPDKPARRIVFAGQPYARARVERVVGKGVGSGQCVALAQSRGFHIAGNAKLWPTLAKEAGYTIGRTPEIGAAIVTSESSVGTSTGHVLIQTGQVDDGWIPIEEQNYISRTITTGWIPADSPLIVAFIYKS
jgi:surface antigen